MRCAFERLPSHIIELMNFCTRSLPYTESGGTSRRLTHPLRGICVRSRFYFCAALGRLAPYFERPCLRFSTPAASSVRSEEHTSELQSRLHLVCRLLLE